MRWELFALLTSILSEGTMILMGQIAPLVTSNFNELEFFKVGPRTATYIYAG